MPHRRHWRLVGTAVGLRGGVHASCTGPVSSLGLHLSWVWLEAHARDTSPWHAANRCRPLGAGHGAKSALRHPSLADPVVANLLALAVEFESKAVALTAEEATEKQVEQTTAGPGVRHSETASEDKSS